MAMDGGVRSPAHRTASSRIRRGAQRASSRCLPDDTWFHPGHGKDSTLGAERPHLAEWKAPLSALMWKLISPTT